MNPFRFFKSRPAGYQEAAGDRQAARSAWGEAKLAYETALRTLERSSTPQGDAMRRLKNKIRGCNEALSRMHLQDGDQYREGGFLEDARALYSLALALSEDARLRSVLIDRLQQTEKQTSLSLQKILAREAPFLPMEDGNAAEEGTTQTQEEHFTALCNMLPDELARIYRGYGRTFREGYCALNRGDFAAAVSALSRAAEETPDSDSYVFLELATAHLNLGHLSQARELLEFFTSRHPDALPAYRMLCDIYWETGEFDQVDSLLAAVPAELRQSLAYELLHGESLHRQGRYADAVNGYRRAMKAYGRPETLLRALAKGLEASGDIAEARRLYGEILDRCNRCGSASDPVVRQQFADLSWTIGERSHRLIDIYLGLARDVPKNSAAYYRRISQIYAERGSQVESLRFRAFADAAERLSDDEGTNG